MEIGSNMEIGVITESLVLKTRTISLRQIEKSDLPIVFQWRNCEKFRLLLHYNTEMVSYADFCKEFSLDSQIMRHRFMIEKIEGNVPIGMIYSDTYSEKCKSAFVNIFVAGPFEKKGFGMQAFVVFALLLFQREGLEKLFAHAFETNDHSISCIKKLGFRELVGNVTIIRRQGKEQRLICFAVGREIVPRLSATNKFLSRVHKAHVVN
jgi:UDP-4-amino-4,6-dideoxy-N-acetyl-beta-L-altrosamine N-acetyltransferase